MSDTPSESLRERTQVLVTFLDSGKIDPTQLRQLIDRLETIAAFSKASRN